jgi:hypothetical protein
MRSQARYVWYRWPEHLRGRLRLLEEVRRATPSRALRYDCRAETPRRSRGRILALRSCQGGHATGKAVRGRSPPAVDPSLECNVGDILEWVPDKKRGTVTQMEKLVEQFRARAADGRVVNIIKFVEVLDAGPTFGNADKERLEVLPGYRTADGRDVNHVAGNEFEVLDTPEPFIVWRT